MPDLCARAAALLLAGALLAGCGNGPGEAEDATGSGIRGRVLAGPACPVVVEESPCPPTPIEADIRVLDVGGETEVATGRSDAEGNFRIPLEPGEYVVEVAAEAGGIGGAKPVSITVPEGEFTQVTLHYDTGVR